ncbi:hypothetical protein ACI1US_02467 [Leucobacter sp. BZR 635]
MITADKSQVEQAFIFGFPLVFNLDQVGRYVETGVGANPAAPFNSFSHARALAGPADNFVSINNDTVYSMAQLDLSVGPVMLEVPDTAGRYYVLQFVDAWTNNFAYVGHRATGTEAGRFLIVPPAWGGVAPADATVIVSPTTVASIVGRWACDGEADLPAVHRLQDAASLTPLNPAATPAGIPAIDAAVPAEVQLLEKLRVWSQEFPPAVSDRAVLDGLAPTGITETGASPYLAASAETIAELGGALAASQAALIDYLRTGDVPVVNGWQLTYHFFDYNTDFFEVGTVNTPLFTSVPPEQKYQMRAAAALGGLWGNHSYEAAYASIYVDETGEQLDGANSYELRLDPMPPARAFWSLTMYSMPDFFLVENEIKRYSIGDRTPGLQHNDDGSLTIFMSATRPADPVKLANWLPAPAGPFRPLLRMYEPSTEIIDGSYVIPAITRVAAQASEEQSND